MSMIELTMRGSGKKVSVNPKKVEFIIDDDIEGCTVCTGSYIPVTERRSIVVTKIRHADG